MNAVVRETLSSVVELFGAISDHVSGADIVRADRSNAERAQQLAYARIAGVREGFQAIRARNEAVSERLAEFRRQRAVRES